MKCRGGLCRVVAEALHGRDAGFAAGEGNQACAMMP
jgi:hypothetical protein